MKVLKICVDTWCNESRDERELTAYRECGADICVMAKGNPGDANRREMVNGFAVYRFSTRPLGVRFPVLVNRVASVFAWACHARRFNADIISGHDITALLIGYMSNFCKPKAKRAKLIYDSHEFEIGRSGKRGKYTSWRVMHIERFLMKRCAFSIMVNDSIADEVQRIHKLKDRPVVVRSTPPRWERDDAACASVRKGFCDMLQVPQDTFLVMYHGGVAVNRGMEQMLRALALLPDVAGVVLGNGEQEYIDSLKALARELGVENRALFHAAVPIEVLKNYVGAVDCGLVTVQNSCMSYYYMLPNKFFENIQSETPIIGSDFPEIRRLTNAYGIGLLCDPSKPEEIVDCITKMQNDRAFYAQCKANLRKAKEELCWENEKETLMAALRGII